MRTFLIVTVVGMGLNWLLADTRPISLVISLVGLIFWTWSTYQGILSNNRREASLKTREKDLNSRASVLDRRANSLIEERRALEVVAQNLNRRASTLWEQVELSNATVARFAPPASERVAPPAKPKPVPPSVYDRLIADDEFSNESTGHPEGS